MGRHFSEQRQLQQVLDHFSGLVRQSTVFQRESRKHRFSAMLDIHNPSGSFYLVLYRGAVFAAAARNAGEAQARAVDGGGLLPSRPTLRFSLSSDTMHDVLSGRIHPAQLALTGKVRVTGNIFSALSLQSLLPEAVRLYRQSVDAVR